eukprot:TCONS_00068504-protein
MDAPWRETVNMENFEASETIQTQWCQLLVEALQRKHYLATKSLLRLADLIYGGDRGTHPSNVQNNDFHLYFRNKELTGSERQRKHDSENISPYMRSIRESKFSYFMVLAVQTNNLKIIRLLLTHQFNILWPHLLDCRCWLCESDKLGQAKRRIETMQALSNPLWINLTCKDPFLTSFRIIKTCRLFRAQQDCYEKEYNLLTRQNVNFCTGLLDQIQNEKEVKHLMRWRESNFEPFKDIHQLAFIRLGFKYNVPEVVAHAVPQHVIMHIVSEGIPGWKSGGIVYRLIFIALVALFYPFTAIIRILAPESYIGRMAVKPLIKFINSVASYITLLSESFVH